MASDSNNIKFTVYKGSKDRQVIVKSFQHKALEGDEVLIEISHSGLCGTDEHYLGTDMVLGHEGAGVIEALGPQVQDLKM